MRLAIVAVAGKEVGLHETAIRRTVMCLPYAASCFMWSPNKPADSNIQWTRIPEVPSYTLFQPLLNDVMLYQVPKIDADYIITCQADGYAVNKRCWTDEYLAYDYIGAPWPFWEMLVLPGSRWRRVGSGGFCMRSRRFLDAQRIMNWSLMVGEDIQVSRIRWRELESAGCRFAPTRLALQWCYEHQLEDYPLHRAENSFGFHGLTPEGLPFYMLQPWRAIHEAWKRRVRRANHINAEIGITGMYD